MFTLQGMATVLRACLFSCIAATFFNQPTIARVGHIPVVGLYQLKKDGIQQSVIWGYNGTLVIAKVANARYDQVFHTSFEEDGTENAAIKAKTGRRVGAGDTYIIPANQRPIAGTYVLSYWKWNGSSWIPAEQTVNYTPSNAPLLGLPAGTIVDEIRLHPKEARMVTFTYDPLVGKISEMDAAGVPIYYEYDEHNRLKFILDQDRNVVKSYYYHYKAN